MIPDRCTVEIWFRSGVGGKAPYVCWTVLLPSGRLHVYAEHLFTPTTEVPAWTEGSCAKAIVSRTENEILPPKRFRLGRAIGNAEMFPKSHAKGEAPYETCQRNGLYLERGDDQEYFGWQRLKHWFDRHPLDGKPWLTISPSCTFMARTIPIQVQHPEAPDLIDPSGETQAAHSLRMGVMARPSPSILDKPRAVVHPNAIKGLIDAEMGGKRRRGGQIR